MRERARAMVVTALAGAVSACSPPVCATADGPDSSRNADLGDASFNVPTGPFTTIPLSGCGGLGYAATVAVGPNAFQLTIDTGSGTLAVASSSCADCNVSPAYTPSTGAMDTEQQVMDSYVQGSWQGEIYTDTVQLAGTGPVKMNIVAIESQTGFFGDAGCGLGTVPFAPQGILGFGPADLARPQTSAFVTKLVETGAAAGVFAFEFCSIGGQLMVGGVDPSTAALTGPAVYTPMTNTQADDGDSGTGYYSVELDDLKLGGVSLGFGAADFGVTAVDTGTSVFALPAAVYDALTSQIQNTPAFATAFGSSSALFGTTTCMSSSLTTAELDAELPPLALVFPAQDGSQSVVTLKPTDSYIPPTQSGGTTYYCSGLLSNPGPTGTILGTSVMLSQLTIFDLDQGEIGFAPQAFCP